MNPGIFLIQDNEELIEMTEQTYESEFPSIPLTTLTQEGNLEKLLAAIEWSNEQVRKQPKSSRVP